MSEKKEDERQSFITEARRAQIVDAAITTLDEIGYANASLAQIARRAGISTALISYHFHDKSDLMNQTLLTLLAEHTSYVLARTQAEPTALDALHTYIIASLAYQGTHPRHNTALLEIIFHARTPEGVAYYKLEDEEEEPLLLELKQILRQGQIKGEFRDFNVVVMANVIRGAIGEYLLNPNLIREIALETYSDELVAIFDRLIKSEREDRPKSGSFSNQNAQ
jgi:TetR/AcrR family transcriptional regulator, transcriptional repressor of bet genes